MGKINLFKTKKGSIQDLFFLTVMLLLLVIGVIIVYHVFGMIYTAMLGTGTFDPTAMLGLNNFLTMVRDYDLFFVLLYMGSGLGTVISAFAIRSHPIFFIGFFLIQVIFLAVTPTIQTIYQDFSASPDLNASVAQFGNTTILMNYLPLLSLFLSIIIAIAMFALPG